MKLENAVIAVTGGASGLGAAAAELCRAKGAKVAVLDMNKEKGEAFAQSLGDNVIFLETWTMTKGYEGLSEKFGKLSGVVSCAGGQTMGTGLTVDKKGHLTHFMRLKKTVELNIIGTFLVASQSAALIAQNEPEDADGERGCIVNVASVAAEDGQNGQIAYGAGKGGIKAMTLPMARDLGKRGIRVNCILPGVFDTPMTAPLKQFRPEVYKNLAQSPIFPNTRLGAPEEFAQMAVAILENKYVNGESIRVDGGIRMGKL
ncbi:unnamed protein product [Durusdinium trenchii]|uniref:3-hydroxyacyl-CoA dehydrogenase n=1 Tax=Durusdinium trenchii TaxID=1381693 RepID=A0ABP0QT58_9DINO